MANPTSITTFRSWLGTGPADNEAGEFLMTNGKTLIALSTAIALGFLGATSVAQASNENDGGNETGGYVLPGSTVGVNPAYHPGWFGKGRSAGGAFGYAPISSHKHKAR
jgi:hypothetical protein